MMGFFVFYNFLRNLLGVICTALYVLPAMGAPSVDDRIISYVNEAKVQLNAGNIERACQLYNLASNLANFKSTNTVLQSDTSRDAKAICIKHERIYAEQLKAQRERTKIENSKFCISMIPIFRDCAIAHDIGSCVLIKSNGINMQEVRNRCGNKELDAINRLFR